MGALSPIDGSASALQAESGHRLGWMSVPRSGIMMRVPNPLTARALPLLLLTLVTACADAPPPRPLQLSVAGDATGRCWFQHRGRRTDPQAILKRLDSLAADQEVVLVADGPGVPPRCLSGTLYTMVAPSRPGEVGILPGPAGH